MASTWKNWAGTETARHAAVARPSSTDEVVEVVRAAAARGQRVKALGTGHSFTGVAVTDGVALDLSQLTAVHAVDVASGEVTVGAGMPLARLCAALTGFGLAMANMGDIDVQTISGAISTGTHGTGARLGGLATQVVGLELVTADGTVHELRDGALFEAARLGLGALGVITKVTLAAVPAFRLHAVERTEPLDDVLATLDSRADAVDHFECYWVPHTDLARTKTNARTDEASRDNGRLTHLVERELLENVAFGAVCRLERRLPQLCRRLAPVVAGGGRRDFVDRSDRVFTSPRRVHFKEMEYAIPRAALAGAVAALRDIVVSDRSLHIAFPVEVRVAAADDVWLSTAHGRDSGYVAVHQYVGMEHERWFRAVEEVMVGLGGRPHWGKLHTRSSDFFASTYPRWHDWQAVRAAVDPTGVFANPYLDRVLGPIATPAATGTPGRSSGGGGSRR